MTWPDVATINAFIEDTCVLAAIAYTIARGPLLQAVFNPTQSLKRELKLGLLYGLIACSEAVFPGYRAPYVTSSLMIALAVVLGTPLIGLVTTVIAVVGFACFGLERSILPCLASFTGALLIDLLLVRIRNPKPESLPARLLIGAAVAAIGQACAVAAFTLMGIKPLSAPVASIAANAFGMPILLLILNDARIRAESLIHQLDLHRTQAMVKEAQLQDLRSRIHPHFMFNALTSIAALCRIDAKRAEKAVVSLGQVMRGALDAPATGLITLSDEVANVRSYLDIEQLRLGDKIAVLWDMDDGLEKVKLPPFALQTLVENAVIHGISKHERRANLKISAHARRQRIVVAVFDTGAGFDRPSLENKADSRHGLSVTDSRLQLLLGPKSRLRLFSERGHGTLAAFWVPLNDGAGLQTSQTSAEPRKLNA